MKQSYFSIKENQQLTETVYKMVLEGDTSEIVRPGQFVNIKIDGLFLRRPISVCDLEGNLLTIIYKVVGNGTEKMSKMAIGDKLDVLTGLGNGYNIVLSGEYPLLVGGGVGIPPLYYLAKQLLANGKMPTVILGFNTKDEIFYYEEFSKLGIQVILTTLDGSCGIKGFVTDAIKTIYHYSYVYTCGPEPMLKAVYNATNKSGQYSFEARMGCGFGACMGCSCETKYGTKRICKDGPVLVKEEIIW